MPCNKARWADGLSSFPRIQAFSGLTIRPSRAGCSARRMRIRGYPPWKKGKAEKSRASRVAGIKRTDNPTSLNPQSRCNFFSAPAYNTSRIAFAAFAWNATAVGSKSRTGIGARSKCPYRSSPRTSAAQSQLPTTSLVAGGMKCMDTPMRRCEDTFGPSRAPGNNCAATSPRPAKACKPPATHPAPESPARAPTCCPRRRCLRAQGCPPDAFPA